MMNHLLIVTIALILLVSTVVAEESLPDARPAIRDRTFHSATINELIDTLKPLIADADLSTLFSNCLPNTLDTTVYAFSNSSSDTGLDSFIITGDITALWLRDSTNQVLPYLPYAPEDEDLQQLIEGLILRQAKSVLIDSFANAFNYNASGEGHQDDIRTPPMTAPVFEGKYEIDSLAAFLKLSYWHWHYSGDAAIERVQEQSDGKWLTAVGVVVETIETMQRDDGSGAQPPYLFQRLTTVATDTLIMQGRGPPAKKNGLSRSLFRPSDDAVTLPFNIPGNAMACVELQHTQELLKRLKLAQSNNLYNCIDSIRSTLCNALHRELETAEADTGGVLPYEIDGYGSQYFMDDANLPSLLSLPVIGYLSTEHVSYTATRDYVLSSQNPFFFSGPFGAGIGGPHEGYNYTWPMALIMQAMTSSSDDEIRWCLQTIVSSSAGTGFLHESFNVNNVNDYTRDWFAWVNGMLGELVLQLILTKPHLVLIDSADAIALAQRLVRPSVSLLAMKSTIL